MKTNLFSFKEIDLKLSAKCWPFCLSLKVLKGFCPTWEVNIPSHVRTTKYYPFHHRHFDLLWIMLWVMIPKLILLNLHMGVYNWYFLPFINRITESAPYKMIKSWTHLSTNHPWKVCQAHKVSRYNNTTGNLPTKNFINLHLKNVSYGKQNIFCYINCLPTWHLYIQMIMKIILCSALNLVKVTFSSNWFWVMNYLYIFFSIWGPASLLAVCCTWGYIEFWWVTPLCSCLHHMF